MTAVIHGGLPELSAFVVEVDDGSRVATVTMTGTGDGNAMGSQVWSELPTLVRALESRDDVRAVVLRGAGECFSVGLDLRWYVPHYRRMTRHGDGPAVREALRRENTRMQEAISAVAASPLPFVAAVTGPCVGAGLDLVAACDVRVADFDAVFSLREIRIGIVADLGSLQRLPRIVGIGHTRELALTGRDAGASEALAMGLVTRVLDGPGRTRAEALDLAADVARHDPRVVAGVQEVLDRTSGMSVEEGLDYVGVWNAAFLPGPEVTDRLTAALRSEV